MAQYRSKAKGSRHGDSGLELSVGQVLAAAGATVIGAFLAKVLNLWGTVAGTAILSVCTSIGAVLILRAMRSTGERIKSQIASMAPTARGNATAVTVERTVDLGPDGTPESASETVVIAAASVPEEERLHATQGDTVAMEVPDLEPEGRVVAAADSRKRTLIAILISSVLVFTLTITTLFLLGALTGDGGRFIHDDGGAGTTIIIEQAPTESGEPSETVTEDPSETASPESTVSEDPGSTTAPTETDDPASTTTAPTEPTTTTERAPAQTPSASPEAAEEALTDEPTTTE